MSERLDFRVHWIDVHPLLSQRERPVVLLERELPPGKDERNHGLYLVAKVARTGRYWVPGESVLSPDPSWAHTQSETHVRVPITAYRTCDYALAAVFGLGLQIGMTALHQLRSMLTTEISEAVLVLGNECTDLGEAEGFRCYVGLAFRV